MDFGGVLVRTVDRAPRTQLAASLGLSTRDMEQIVFESPSAIQAAVGAISEEQHWKNVIEALKLPESKLPRVHEEFFRGDFWDETLFDFVRGLRKTIRTGLISNAWTGLRAVIVKHRFEDAFDTMIISAEVQVAKPDARIYQLALEKLELAAGEAVFVDDVPSNVEAARAVGMQAIQFTQSQEVMEEIRQLLANHR
ncbi:MAG: HAD family phosphatase [Anaerolineales bacterium]